MKNFFSGWRYLWKSADIRKKLLVTLGLLIIYRLAANIPAPGIDAAVLKELIAMLRTQGTFVDFLDLLSGGTVSRFSLLAMGVYPYITAQIVLQVLIPIFPSLQRKMQEDPREGRKWMEKWTYYLAVPMALLSAIGQINTFNALAQTQVVAFGFTKELWLSSVTLLCAMVGGTMFAIWLGELISEYGIRGQGLSLIIFAGIVARMPASFGRIWADEQYRWVLLITMLVVMVFTIFVIVYVQQGRRNVPVMYPGRRVGNRMSMPVKGTLPLMVNMAGMIPLIFAGAFLQLPVLVAALFFRSGNARVVAAAQDIQNLFNGSGPNAWVYWVLYFFLVVVMTYFYTDILFAQQNYGENLKRIGAQIPGVNRGEPTQQYLTKVLRRITLPGALMLGFVSILPFLLGILLQASGVSAASSSAGIFLVSAAGLLIVVGVVRDTFMAIDAELKIHGYEESLLVR